MADAVRIRHLPVWAFLGAKDVDQSIRLMVVALQAIGVPAVSLTELLGSGEALADPAGLLERLKNAPLPWGVERVIILGDTPEAAPAFWFLASEILGIEGLAVGAAPGGLGLAARATGGHAGVGL